MEQVWIREMPENFGKTGGETHIHPIGLAAVLVLGIATLILPRRWAVFPMLVVACFIPSSQILYILGLNFNLLRIMVIFAVIRLLYKKEYRGFRWGTLDKVIIAYILSSMAIYTIQQGTFSALINRMGASYDVLGMYFLFRCLIRNCNDLSTVIFGVIVISIPVALIFLLENRTGQNLFAFFGGVPSITMVRDGRMRCQGAFPHPILAGCFWASLLPLIAGLWWKSPKYKVWALTGLITSCIIVLCSASSTPIAGVLAALIGGLMFYCRQYMRSIFWGGILILICLHLMMKAPVWHLIARFSAIGGGTGWHRYLVLNGAITHFHEWAIWGASSTAHWGWGVQDITNQYVLEGVRGGFLSLSLFIAIIAIAFNIIGKKCRNQKIISYQMILSWALGVSLFVHCVNFFGVSYFGQINILWYMTLATIGSLAVQPNSISVNSLKLAAGYTI